MGPLDVVQLTPLMDRTPGRPEINVGLIDGPVALSLPDSRAPTFVKFPENSEERAIEPTLLLARMEPS